MEAVAYNSEVSTTFISVRDLSFSEKKASKYNEENINKFLDKVLDFKVMLSDKTEKLNGITLQIEKLTWFDTVDEEGLRVTNDLISAIKDLHSTLIRQYLSLSMLRSKGIAKPEIKAFKEAIDDLKESYQDLESVFFYLPGLDDFKETTRLLSLK